MNPATASEYTAPLIEPLVSTATPTAPVIQKHLQQQQQQQQQQQTQEELSDKTEMLVDTVTPAVSCDANSAPVDDDDHGLDDQADLSFHSANGRTSGFGNNSGSDANSDKLNAPTSVRFYLYVISLYYILFRRCYSHG